MKKRFTFVDFAIIVVVLALVAGGYYYLSSKSIIKGTVEGHSFGYTLCLSNIEAYLAEEFDEGDVVFDATKQIEIGKVDKVEIQPYEEIYPNNLLGKYQKREVPDRFRVLLHITSDKANVSENSATVNNYELYIGKTCYIKGDNFACTSVVWGLDTEEGVQ